MTTKNQTATVTYTIENASPESLTANLTRAIDHTNEEWFEITADFDKTSIDKERTAKMTVTVKLLKTPATSDDETVANDTITISIGTEAVQPTV